MPITALHVALLAAAGEAEGVVHRLHGELEHWLNRTLASDEIDAALAELHAGGYAVVTSACFVSTASGRALVAEQWEDFFPL
jgi:hypothetical protein